MSERIIEDYPHRVRTGTTGDPVTLVEYDKIIESINYQPRQGYYALQGKKMERNGFKYGVMSYHNPSVLVGGTAYYKGAETVEIPFLIYPGVQSYELTTEVILPIIYYANTFRLNGSILFTIEDQAGTNSQNILHCIKDLQSYIINTGGNPPTPSVVFEMGQTDFANICRTGTIDTALQATANAEIRILKITFSLDTPSPSGFQMFGIYDYTTTHPVTGQSITDRWGVDTLSLYLYKTSGNLDKLPAPGIIYENTTSPGNTSGLTGWDELKDLNTEIKRVSTMVYGGTVHQTDYSAIPLMGQYGAPIYAPGATTNYTATQTGASPRQYSIPVELAQGCTKFEILAKIQFRSGPTHSFDVVLRRQGADVQTLSTLDSATYGAGESIVYISGNLNTAAQVTTGTEMMFIRLDETLSANNTSTQSLGYYTGIHTIFVRFFGEC